MKNLILTILICVPIIGVSQDIGGTGWKLYMESFDSDDIYIDNKYFIPEAIILFDIDGTFNLLYLDRWSLDDPTVKGKIFRDNERCKLRWTSENDSLFLSDKKCMNFTFSGKINQSKNLVTGFIYRKKQLKTFFRLELIEF